MSTATPATGTALAPTRPPTVRLLGWVLLVEAATGAMLTVLSLVTAVIAAANRHSGDWADLAIVVTLVLAALAGATAVAFGLAWMFLRARRAVPFWLALVVAHLLPLIGAVRLGLVVDALPRVLLALTLVPLVTISIGLALGGATRAWLASRPE